MTDDRITAEERARWQALHEKATPGPWEATPRGRDRRAARLAWKEIRDPSMRPVVHAGSVTIWGEEGNQDHDAGVVMSEPDAAFIAASRSAVPRLLAALAEAEERLDGYSAMCAEQEARADALAKALREVLRSHEDCDDGSGMICSACAIALSVLPTAAPAAVPTTNGEESP
jgi:hypothetical protein